MARGRKGKATHNVEYYMVYSNEYYCDVKHPQVYERNQLQEVLDAIGITYKTLCEYMSKGRLLSFGLELYKQPIEGELERLV